MKLLITGGSGLLGSRIAQIASSRGYKVYSGYYMHTPKIGLPIKLNILELNSLSAIIKDISPEVIIHAAALTNVDKCETDRDLAYKTNVTGTKVIAELAERINASLVYVSSDYIFDGTKGMYTEIDTPNPINYYGHTKLLGEKYCNNFSIVRTSVIYGANPAGGKNNFVLWILDKLRRAETINIVTDQYVTPTLNTNLAKMIINLVEENLRGIFHLAGATRVSRYEFTLKVAEIFDLDVSLIRSISMKEINWTAKRPKDSSLDTSKASRYLKTTPDHLDEALKTLKKEVMTYESGG